MNDAGQPGRIFRSIFNLWVVGGALVFGALLFGMAALLVWLTRPGPGMSPPATPIMIVIPAPTATLPIPSPTPEAATPTSAIPPSPPPGVLAVGAYVEISGTGGDGLRARSEPGLQGEIRFLALESEVFQVTDGPREADGYIWWYLVAPADASRQGWAAANFLSVVQNP
jgi:hypothetical protein